MAVNHHFPNNRILVTGATGFIGKHLVKLFLEEKTEVRLFCRSPKKAAAVFKDADLDIVYGDLNSQESLREAVKGCSSVFNIAGCYEFGPSSKKRLFDANVTGLKKFLQIWKETNPNGRFAHVSTAGFWEQSENGELKEAYLPDWANYKKSKSEGEALIRQAHRDGMDAIVLNPTCPVGAGDSTPTPTGRIIHDFINGNFPVSCHTGINLIHVEDLVEGMVHAWKNHHGSQPVIFGNENLWINDVLKQLSEITDIPAPRLTAPTLLIKVAGEVGERIDSFFPGFSQKNQLCRETAWLAGKSQFFKLDEQYQKLGWRPQRSVKQALREATEWYQAQEKVKKVVEKNVNRPLMTAEEV